MPGETILVVDDDPGLLILMQARLEAAGYTTLLADDGKAALQHLQTTACDLAIVDLKMDGMDGLALLQELLQRLPALPVIILTAHGTIASAVEATKKGAYDYLTKPFEAQDLLYRIDKALEMQRLKGEVARLHTLVQQRYHFDNIVAASARMQQVLSKIGQIASTDSSVAIYGESGTGKELIAKAIHTSSRRARHPFVAINCGAIPEGLLENELFGHLKGAYTGADRSKTGLLQQADGGTLFLDEVAELPPLLQIKFLRVLQEREFTPLGAVQPTLVDFRLIVATNQDLWKAVRERKFREDLYYRIHVIPVVLPPLRERREDIPLLVQHFLQQFSLEKPTPLQIAPEAMQRLMLHDWPGNVRELGNVIECAVALTTQDIITSDLLFLNNPTASSSARQEVIPLKEAQGEFERAYLVHLLTTTKGNVSQAAALAGRYRADFYKLLRKHDLTPGDFKTDPRAM
ncbi:MAG: sigma-54-dependent transcriptional regulator [Candidatus Tectimicrobiota bacterium]